MAPRPRVPRPGRATDGVREYLEGHPSVRRALALGLVNDAALARRIRTESGDRLSFEAVAVALRRSERTATSADSSHVAVSLLTGGITLELRTGYSVLRLPDEDPVLSALLAGPWSHGPRGRPDRTLIHVEEGMPYISVALPTEALPRVVRTLPPGVRRTTTDGLALVVLETQGAASDTPGVIAFLSDLLGEHNLVPRLLAAAGDRVEFLAPDADARRIFDLLHRLRRSPLPAPVPEPPQKGSSPSGARPAPGGPPIDAGAELRTGAEVARHYVAGHPSVADCLAYGVVNVTALARRIGDEVGFAHTEAIEAALRRWKPERGPATSVEGRVLSVVRESRIEVRTRVALVTAPPNWELLARLVEVGPAPPANRRRLFQVLQSPTAVTVLCEEDLLEPILQAIGPRHSIVAERGLAAVAVHSPEAILETPGVLAFLSGALYRAGLNCLELMSLHLESTFVVRQADALATFRVLSDLIHPTAAP
ncbi:MAG: ACT domain-containing protein [Thermoplasmata archaeon]|nr:ACT domain-containing protein [Thermoplasmata archaeon]